MNNENFDQDPMFQFIKQIYEIENKCFVSPTDKDTLCVMYQDVYSRIFLEIMNHRNRPVPPQKLKKLKTLNPMPISIGKVLDSLD